MKHIVILKEKYYNMIISGEKTIESRWSMNKCAPYKKVAVGDELLIKQMGKPVTLTAKVSNVMFFELTPKLVDELRVKYGKQIGTDKKEDWESALNKKYATLVWLKDVKEVDEIIVKRSNGAGWIVCENEQLAIY